ncbi:protein of unknown function [Moritella yayanosii]|uniref:Uncharacterized protein n=1 Tax=Moritella yayanosii TaxID=69539 RepID=A0A330LVQ5_9GAMM|nr:protein of unknown function [Moritella yayanosii]
MLFNVRALIFGFVALELELYYALVFSKTKLTSCELRQFRI